MKKIRALLVSVIAILCLTGCMRFSTTITVKPNGKVDVEMLYAAMSMSDYGMEESELLSEEEKQDIIDKGWDVEDYSEGEYQGYILSRKDVSSEELSDSLKGAQSEETGTFNDISFAKDGLTYKLDWKVFDEETGAQMKEYKNYFTSSGGYMKLIVKLPIKATDSNATTVSEDGKTLEWDLMDLGPDQNVHLEFSLINVKLFVILGLIGAIIVAAIIVAVTMSSRKKKAVQQPMGYYQQPGVQDPMQQAQQNPMMQQGGQSQYMQQNAVPQDIPQSMQGQYAPPQMQQPVPEQPAAPQSLAGNLVADELTKLKKLLDDGVITQEEFNAQKTKLLGGSADNN